MVDDHADDLVVEPRRPSELQHPGVQGEERPRRLDRGWVTGRRGTVAVDGDAVVPAEVEDHEPAVVQLEVVPDVRDAGDQGHVHDDARQQPRNPRHPQRLAERRIRRRVERDLVDAGVGIGVDVDSGDGRRRIGGLFRRSGRVDLQCVDHRRLARHPVTST